MNKPLLVLLVDDDDSFREIFSTKLKAEGFQVETAKNGDEGVTKAGRLKPDLILMDMEMPGLNGAGAVIKLKEDSKTKDVKIAFLTNYGEPKNGLHEADRHFAKELGAVEYVKKTDDLDTISDRVKELI
jgi:CheY-like chemotaxis protein